MNRKSGVLLDLDGTLIDTAPDLAGAVNAVRRARGMDSLPLARLRNHCSWGAGGMLRAGLGLARDDSGYSAARHEFLQAYSARLTAESRPFPEIRATLTELAAHGLPWGVVTNKLEAYTLPLMAAMDFQPPPACIVGGDSTNAPKPAPAPILLGCQRAGLRPDRSVYVGDSERDITAGRAAGMHTIAVAYGYFEPDDLINTWGADCVIGHAGELAPAVLNLLERPLPTAAHD